MIRQGMNRLANNFLFKDRCALPDQMSFVLTFPWGGFVLAMRDRDRANKNEIAVLAFGVTTKDIPHDMLLPGTNWVNVYRINHHISAKFT